MPPALRNRPDTGLVSSLLVEAFFFLQASRMPGFNGPNPLVVTHISSVAGMFGYTSPDEEYAFIKAIQAIDGVYLELESDRIKQRQKQKRK
jgi:hypothetical protein